MTTKSQIQELATEMIQILKDIIKNYDKAPGKFWLPNYLNEHIEKSRALINQIEEK